MTQNKNFTTRIRLILTAACLPLLMLFALRPMLQASTLSSGSDRLADLTRASDPATAVADAWERAKQAGSYAFTADVTQATIPLATTANVGRSSKTTRYYMEGSADPQAGDMAFTLWGDGGSVLDPASGISIRVADNVVQARQGQNGPWETIDNYGALFAPEGDFMAFLIAARDVKAHPADRGATRYTFTVDGPAFAQFMRVQLQQQMIASGEMLPNTTLEVPQIYAEMTGSGALWVGANGFPLRQEIHLDLPEAASTQEGTTLAVDSIVTFSGFDQAAAAATPTISISAATEAATNALPPLLGVGLAFVLVAALVVNGRSRTVYAAFAIGLSAAMLLTPILQTVHAVRADTIRAERRAAADARQAESEMAQAVETWRENNRSKSLPPGALEAIRNDDGTDSDGDGYSDVVEQMQGTPVLEGTAVTTAVDPANNDLFLEEACLDIVDNGYTSADADGDGLTDYEECLLGTSSETSVYRDGVTPDGRDSDGDTIPDLWEVVGVAYAGEHWYTDPLEADSNGDTLPDSIEWEVDGDNNGVIDDSDGDGIPDMRDTDADGTPDLLDHDNDGDGVPDRLDNSPFTASAQPILDGDGNITGYSGRTFDDDTPLVLNLDNLTSNRLTFVEFQLRPTNPDHLWYALNVLDWPQHDRRGQMQDADNLTFLDVNTGQQAAANDGFGDIKLVPMLEIHILGANSGLPSPDLLAEYGISLQDDSNGTLAYVPLQVVADNQSDAKVAFYAKMLFLPWGNWPPTSEVNLVWMVQGLVDRCESYEYVDANGETQQSNDCQSYSATNEVEVIHVYDNDPWYLTGLNIREDHGVDFAIIYEDPAVDTNPDDDEPLVQLAQGFDYSFLTGRDCGSGDTCQPDGVRDVTIDTIYERWNRTTNAAISPEQRWGISNTLRVQTASFNNIDFGLATIAMTTTVNLLENAFGAQPTEPVTPTLLFAREETYRAASLDNLGVSLSWLDNRLTVDMDPALVPLDVLAGVNWSAYTHADGAWQSLSPDGVWAELARRYAADFSDQETEVGQGMLIAVQLYYSSLLVGINRIVQTNGELLPVSPSLDVPDKPLAFSVLKGVGAAAKTITTKFILAGMVGIQPDKFNSFYRYLRSVFSYTLDESVRNNWIGLRDNLGKLTSLSGWRLNLSTGGVIAGALLLVGVAIGLSFAFGGDTVGRAVLAGVVGLVLAAVTLIGPILELKSALQAAEGLTKTIKALGSLNALSKASKAAGVIGLIISIGIAIGAFIYQWVEGDLSAGSPAFNYLLAATIAAIALAVLLFVLGLTIVGSIIVALLAIVDIILMIAGVDFSVTTWLTEKLTDYYYTYEPIFDTDVELGSMGMSLDDPERGLGQGATFSYQTEITTTITMTDPNWQAAGYVGTSFFNRDDFDDAVFVYSLTDDPEIFTDSDIDRGFSRWNIEVDRSWGLSDLYRGNTTDDVAVSGVVVPVGINQSPTFFLNSGYDTPAYECWGQGILAYCYTEPLTGTDYVNLGTSMFYDIFPETIGTFMALDWAGDYRSFPAPADHDGDGQLAIGLDPDDSDWDVDDDGLADGFEIALRGFSRADGGFPISYLSSDTDADGLCDRDEIRYGTDPADRDTDGDGLEDSEEVLHRDCVSGEWAGGWEFTYLLAADAPDGQDHSRRIFSDPLKADADGDGFNDRIEKLIHEADPANFPFHPQVYNDSPGGLYPEVSEVDGVLFPGQTAVYTMTVRNNFPDPYWVYGGITVTMPAALGGGVFNNVTYDPDGAGSQPPLTAPTFNLYPENTAVLAQSFQVAPGTGSSVQTIAGELRSQLSADGDISYDWVLGPGPAAPADRHHRRHPHGRCPRAHPGRYRLGRRLRRRRHRNRRPH